MLLNQLTSAFEAIEITGLTADSREVQPGFLFGSLNDDKFIADALAKGAAAVIIKEDCSVEIPSGVAVIRSANPARDFAAAAARFFGGQPEHICAVTGTNGKTSIADFIRQILTMMGHKAASCGTLGFIRGNEAPTPSPNTTPVSVTLQRELKKLADDGYDWLALEASSHGLCQYRLGSIPVEVAGFTNLTRDHLDYHKTMENYLEAKLILFRENLVAGGTAVLNADIAEFQTIAAACLETGKKVISYGHQGQELKLLKASPMAHGQKLEIEYFGQPVTIEIPLAGEFQAMNVLCALGMAAALTGQPQEVIKYIGRIHGAKGRLELVGQTPNGAAVYVDYAHTPDALENVIRTLRPHTSNRLHVLFGCGGDRDAGKRPIMGQIADSLADVVYVTDDNPRTEDAAKIRAQILAACPKGCEFADRAQAIRTAVAALEPGDILILAGKGHETGQYVNGKILPFSDHEEAQKAIADLRA